MKLLRLLCWKLRHPCWVPRRYNLEGIVGWMWECPCGKVGADSPDHGLGTECSPLTEKKEK